MEAQERVLGKRGHAEMLTESAKGSRNLLVEALGHTMMSRWPQGWEVRGLQNSALICSAELCKGVCGVPSTPG